MTTKYTGSMLSRGLFLHRAPVARTGSHLSLRTLPGHCRPAVGCSVSCGVPLVAGHALASLSSCCGALVCGVS